MRYLLIFCGMLLLWMPSAFSEISDADLDKIRLIVKEEVKPIKLDVEAVKVDVARIDGRLDGFDGRFGGIEKQISHATNVTYGLIALIVVAIGMPAWRSRKDKEQERRMAAQDEKIDMLLRELETLKQEKL